MQQLPFGRRWWSLTKIISSRGQFGPSSGHLWVSYYGWTMPYRVEWLHDHPFCLLCLSDIIAAKRIEGNDENEQECQGQRYCGGPIIHACEGGFLLLKRKSEIGSGRSKRAELRHCGSEWGEHTRRLRHSSGGAQLVLLKECEYSGASRHSSRSRVDSQSCKQNLWKWRFIAGIWLEFGGYNDLFQFITNISTPQE